MYKLFSLAAIFLLIAVNAQPIDDTQNFLRELGVNSLQEASFDPEDQYSDSEKDNVIQFKFGTENQLTPTEEPNHIEPDVVMTEDKKGHMRPKWHQKIKNWFMKAKHHLGRFGDKVESTSEKVLHFLKEFLPVFQKAIEEAHKDMD